MKTKYAFALTIAAISALLLAACQTETKQVYDTVPPAPPTDIRFVPSIGGGYFFYTIPADEDFLYVKAVYKIDSGKEITRSASAYSDTLYVSGFGTVKEYPVDLYSVDRYGNQSKAVRFNIVPDEAAVYSIAKTVSMQVGFSSLIVNMVNKVKEEVNVYVTLNDGTSHAVKVLSSNEDTARLVIYDLGTATYHVTAHVEDRYGNASEEVDYGDFTPLLDKELDKTLFSFLDDSRIYGNHWNMTDPDNQHPYEGWESTYTYDSLKNARPVQYEGNILKFWDGLYDVDGSSYNFFHTGHYTTTGSRYPFSYFIDLGQEVQLSRMRLHQRWANAWSSSSESVKTCEIYISNDRTPEDGILTDWEYVGTYTIQIPVDAYDKKKELENGTLFWLYPDNPAFTRTCRYVRYKATDHFRNGGVETNPYLSGCMSEITFYGQRGE